jgi:hypothetical protein
MKKQEQAIKDIVKKYGETINLKTSPYLIGEIIRNYAHVFSPNLAPGNADDSAPEPGTPPVPGGLPELNAKVILTELAKLSNNVKLVHQKLDKLLK